MINPYFLNTYLIDKTKTKDIIKIPYYSKYEYTVFTLLRKLSELVPEKYRSLVYCIHIDGENFIREARKCGVNVVNIN